MGRAVLTGKARSWAWRLLLAALALLMFSWLGEQAFTFCLTQVIKTQPAEQGVLSSNYTGSAIILRKETVVTASEAGSVKRLVPEATRVATGTAIVQIEGAVNPGTDQGQVVLLSPAAGIVSFYLDGWEGILTPKNVDKMDLAGLFKTVDKNPPDNTPPVINDGEPVFKIIDNLVDPDLVTRLDALPSDLPVGSEVDLQWTGGGSGEGRLLSLDTTSGAAIAVVELKESNQDLSNVRTMDITMVKKQYEGILIPASALVSMGNDQGVYIRSPLGFHFFKVQVLGTLGNEAALQGIPPGAEVVVNPGLAERIVPAN